MGQLHLGASLQTSFSYAQAFDRNIGWVTEAEQASLRGRTVAIAGMGGVGGIHMLTLARQGIGGFRVADFDTFGIANMNRQAGAFMSTMDRPKLDVMAEAALDINPELRIERFPHGVTTDNVDDFLCGADLFVDGFDFFELGIRRQVFARAEQLGIPAVTAGPIGMGTGYLAFVPGGMTFEQYFRLDGQSEEEQFLRFLMGLVPRGLHRTYLVDPSRINLRERRGPSTAAACQLCAGVVGVMALQLLLRRPGLRPAPWNHHFDPYRGRLATTWLPQGNHTPSQRIRLALARRALLRSRPPAAMPIPPAPAPAPAPAASGPLRDILAAARWAPSGDNSQPWRFELLDDETVRIHIQTEAGQNPYEYRDGEPSVLAAGMLLENLRLAATAHGRRLEWSIEAETDPYRILARIPAAPDIAEDPLASVLALRSVDRRPYLSRPLRPHERIALEAAAGPELQVNWYETRGDRLRLARLGMMATDIRLRAQETFGVHQAVIDWSPGHSTTGLPAGALGLDHLTLRTMRWAMAHWPRMHMMNRVAGTWAAAAQLDIRPALGSAAFFTLAARPAVEGEDRIARLLHQGGAVQRFWLTAARLGLAMQPGIATLIFAHYGAHGLPFTRDTALQTKAARLSRRFQALLGQHPDTYVFLGRIGEPVAGLPRVRSVRRDIGNLMYSMPAVQPPT